MVADFLHLSFDIGDPFKRVQPETLVITASLWSVLVIVVGNVTKRLILMTRILLLLNHLLDWW